MYLTKEEEYYLGKVKIIRDEKTKLKMLEIEKEGTNLQNIKKMTIQRQRLINSNLIIQKDYEIHEMQSNSKNEIIKRKYEYLNLNLKKEVDKRKTNKNYFLPIELLRIIYDCINGLAFLEENKIKHGFVNPSLIYLYRDQNNFFRAKIMERLEMEEEFEKNYLKDIENSSVDIYFAPELYNQSHSLKIGDINKSDLFSLGLVILEAAILQKVQGLYNFVQKVFLVDKLYLMIEELKSLYKNNELFCSIMETMLEIDTEKRYNFIEFRDSLPEFDPLKNDNNFTPVHSLSFNSNNQYISENNGFKSKTPSFDYDKDLNDEEFDYKKEILKSINNFNSGDKQNNSLEYSHSNNNLFKKESNMNYKSNMNNYDKYANEFNLNNSTKNRNLKIFDDTYNQTFKPNINQINSFGQNNLYESNNIFPQKIQENTRMDLQNPFPKYSLDNPKDFNINMQKNESFLHQSIPIQNHIYSNNQSIFPNNFSDKNLAILKEDQQNVRTSIPPIQNTQNNSNLINKRDSIIDFYSNQFKYIPSIDLPPSFREQHMIKRKMMLSYQSNMHSPNRPSQTDLNYSTTSLNKNQFSNRPGQNDLNYSITSLNKNQISKNEFPSKDMKYQNESLPNPSINSYIPPSPINNKKPLNQQIPISNNTKKKEKSIENVYTLKNEFDILKNIKNNFNPKESNNQVIINDSINQSGDLFKKNNIPRFYKGEDGQIYKGVLKDKIYYDNQKNPIKNVQIKYLPLDQKDSSFLSNSLVKQNIQVENESNNNYISKLQLKENIKDIFGYNTKFNFQKLASELRENEEEPLFENPVEVQVDNEYNYNIDGNDFFDYNPKTQAYEENSIADQFKNSSQVPNFFSSRTSNVFY